jgi:hypothetical protein
VSVIQAVAQAETADRHAQSLFGPGPLPTTGATDGATAMRQAQQQTTGAVSAMGDTAGATRDSHDEFAQRAAGRLGSAAGTDTAFNSQLAQAAEISRAGKARLDAILAQIQATKAAAAGATSPAAERQILGQLQSQLQQAKSVVDSTRQQAAGLAGGVQMLGYGEFPEAPPGPLPEDPKKPPVDDATRRMNERRAFRRIFGRDPTSKSDWTTAAALDPTQYDPKFHGVPPEIKVVKINPVEGQGVVRSSQWIETDKVWSWPPGTNDIGNNRGPNAHFDPGDTKVTTYIDYDNGLVVMRQNPSTVINDDGSLGETRVGVPTGTVTQTADGAVRIQYDSGNPFAPDISRDPNLTMGHPVTVNGDLVFTPGANGVTVGGTRTDYPSMEVYQDMPNGTTNTVLLDRAASGQPWGPSVNLPFHHDVGIGPKAWEPFNTGGWNTKFDVPTPLPGTAFGDPWDVPSVPPPPTGGGHPV